MNRKQELLATPGSRHVQGAELGTHVFDVVSEEIKQRIRRGEWLPGIRLPSITKLAAEMGVSTASVREALRSLQSIGLIKIEHGRGVFVTGGRSSSELNAHVHRISQEEIVALAEARRILEPELAAFAAERGTDEELAEIEQLAKNMEQVARQGCDFAEPDVQFHRRITQIARNPVLYHFMESFHDLFLVSRKVTANEPGMTARAVRYHLLIAEALRDRNAAQARLLMLAHMNDALSGLLMAEAKSFRDED